jgi:hypothetical protein
MKTYIALIAAGCLLAFSSGATVITNFNFSSDTPGSNPLGWTSITPSTPKPGIQSATVTNVSGNNQVNLLDYTNAANAYLQQDISNPGITNAHLSLSFTRNANIAPATTVAGLYVSLGGFGLTQGTGANRALDIRLFNDGSYRVDRGLRNGSGIWTNTAASPSGTSFEAAASPFAAHTLDIFTFGGTAGQTLTYTGPDAGIHVLDNHSFAIYIDNVLVTSGTNTLNGNYDFQSASFTNDNAVVGRFGLVTASTTAVGIDFLVDNIVLSDIAVVPEPSTLFLLGIGGLLLIGVQRIRSPRSR